MLIRAFRLSFWTVLSSIFFLLGSTATTAVDGFSQSSTLLLGQTGYYSLRAQLHGVNQSRNSRTDLNRRQQQQQQQRLLLVTMLRGGSQEQPSPQSSTEADETTTTTSRRSNSSSGALNWAAAVPLSVLTSFGKRYATSLERNPILTKSVTAGCIFALSDWMAQCLEKQSPVNGETPRNVIDWSRMLTSAAVGLFYFGPAAHYWYDMIFRILPGSTIVSILQKAALGQAFFGPAFTCIFFATGLMQSGTFSMRNWFQKIRQDLPSVWLNGALFWVSVDLVSYSFIAKQWIPLFVNFCSLIWTTYLVLKSYSV